jgi:hypothetical protein
VSLWLDNFSHFLCLQSPKNNIRSKCKEPPKLLEILDFWIDQTATLKVESEITIEVFPFYKVISSKISIKKGLDWDEFQLYITKYAAMLFGCIAYYHTRYSGTRKCMEYRIYIRGILAVLPSLPTFFFKKKLTFENRIFVLEVYISYWSGSGPYQICRF